MKLYNRKWQHLYGRKWQRIRRIFLKKNPICVYCLQTDKTTRADTVDHILPHKGDPGLFWDQSNWQPLCKRCHDSVKAKEESRGYVVGCDATGMPLDRQHKWNK